jgi:hypothetical protein
MNEQRVVVDPSLNDAITKVFQDYGKKRKYTVVLNICGDVAWHCALLRRARYGELLFDFETKELALAAKKQIEQICADHYTALRTLPVTGDNTTDEVAA